MMINFVLKASPADASLPRHPACLVITLVGMALLSISGNICMTVAVPIKPEQKAIMLALKSLWNPTEVAPSWDPTKDCSEWFNVWCNKQGGIVGIVLSGFPLKGSIPDDVSRLTDLRQLSLDATGLKGSIPGAALGNLKRLRLLSLGDNNFTGGIPLELGSLPLLETLDLYGNVRLGGGLPPALGNLPQLTTMNIYNCGLTGGIPDTFGKLKKLRLLDLSGNRLSGKVPSFLGRTAAVVPNLRILRLQKNALTGHLLPLTGVGLVELDVSENFLYGPSLVADKSGTYCPATTKKKYKTFKTERNCFTAAPNCPTQAPQRGSSTCHLFCGTNTASGQCGGHGICVLSSKLRPVCKCDAGYQQPLGNSRTCVKK